MSLDPAFLLHRLSQMPGQGHYCVAYSGGRDSRVLLDLMVRLRDQQPEIHLTAIHIHHGLQSAADAWAKHCEATCRASGVELEIVKVQVVSDREQGPEAAARDARYQAFAQRLRESTVLLLAHHQDDQAETLMLQLLRGAGHRGLAAMPDWVNFAGGWLARPLLPVAASAIEDYARQQGLSWVEDSSNQNCAFDRNFLRHQVFPLLRQRWPSVSRVLARVAGHQSEVSLLLTQIAQQDWHAVQAGQQGSAANRIRLSRLNALPLERKRNVLRYWLADICHLATPDTRQLNRILTEVIPAGQDAQPCVSWPGGEVRRYRGELYAGVPLAEHDHTMVLPWDLESPLPVPTAGCTLKANTHGGQGIAAELFKSKHNLSIRFRLGGERCQPVGRLHHHSLKKLFQEWGIPPWMRDRVPLVYIDDELAQVIGYCRCQPFEAKKGEPAIEIFSVPAGFHEPGSQVD